MSVQSFASVSSLPGRAMFATPRSVRPRAERPSRGTLQRALLTWRLWTPAERAAAVASCVLTLAAAAIWAHVIAS
ncbi:hypothetical protein NK718_04430 [Alsobacter sp. SYSU M60028]|uniref:Uncharacterized protein n=1 Tax=Alsobacter ponti TaxID=2962936 RepID=A0ABT1L9I1_9HYPH|nr:hypothetical protein [Alsobacter ponti]MCP8937751.1 hypothetical protein [Alsobacter ponti]